MTTPTLADAETLETAVALRVAVARIHRALRTRPDRQVTASQASALARIEQDGPLRLGVLAHLEGVSPATMSKVVNALAEHGLIERIPDEADGRASLVRLSPEGAATLHGLRTSGARAIATALGDLSPEESSALGAALPALARVAELMTTPAEGAVR